MVKAELKIADHKLHPSLLTNDAIEFLRDLHLEFDVQRKDLLQKRKQRQRQLDSDPNILDFLEETAWIREDASWTGPPLAPGLVDRRVEITGPVDRKMVINALNSGATQFMADFEGSGLF